MILRQFCARHGRTVLSRSSQTLRRSYATETPIDASSKVPGQDGILQARPTSHLDEPLSGVNNSTITSNTGRTRLLDIEIDSAESMSKILQLEMEAYKAVKAGGLDSIQALLSPESTPQTRTLYQAPNSEIPSMPFSDYKEYKKFRHTTSTASRAGTRVVDTYDPSRLVESPPRPEEVTLPLLLANQTHLGHHTSLWNPANSSYIYGVRDGIHIISLDITYAYLQRACKIIEKVAYHGGLILFAGTRKGQTDIVVRAAARAKGYHIFDRWVAGGLTNGQQILGDCAVKIVDAQDRELPQYRPLLSQGLHSSIKPDLVVCLNPLENEVLLHECGLYNVPTIGIIDTDANPSWVTYPIPANDDSLRSTALIAGCLSRAAAKGQTERLEAAKHGKTTYGTEKVSAELIAVESRGALDVQGRQKDD